MDNHVTTNNRLIAKNAIYMYIRMFVMMAVSLYTSRVVLNVLGIDDYGIYNVVASVVVFFSFINSGLAGATKRFILAELSVGDLFSQRKVYSLAINAHLLIIAIILLAGETIGVWVLHNMLNIPEGRVEAASYVYQLSLFTAIIGVLQSPFSSVIISHERMSAFAFFSIFDAFLKLGVVFLVMLIDSDKLMLYAMLLLFVAFADVVLYFFYCRTNFEMCRYVKSHDWNIFKSILNYIGWTVFGSGANVLSRQGVSILINNFFTVAVNAAMGISNVVVSVASQFVNNLQMAFAPQLTMNYISKNYATLNQLILRSSRYTSFLILLILIPIFFVISDLLTVWLGKYPEYTEEFCLITLLCVYLEAISLPLATVITSDKKIGKYQIIMTFFYLFNFIFSWIFLMFVTFPYVVMIVRGILDIGIVISRLILTQKKVGEFDPINWMLLVIGKTVIILILCLPLFAINSFVQFDNIWLRFFIRTMINLIWGASAIWFLGTTHEEKQFVYNKIKEMI